MWPSAGLARQGHHLKLHSPRRGVNYFDLKPEQPQRIQSSNFANVSPRLTKIIPAILAHCLCN